jgi:bis(5'-nucleosidyl)-tetraphosphatase
VRDLLDHEEDQSFGIVPIFFSGKETHVFILRHLSGYWGFPKGHPNPGETELDTAKRELFEETGLYVDKVLSEKMLQEAYSFRVEGKTIHKTVSYFIATVTATATVIDMKEAREGKWVDINEAPMHLTFKEAQRICRETCQVLRGTKHEAGN